MRARRFRCRAVRAPGAPPPTPTPPTRRKDLAVSNESPRTHGPGAFVFEHRVSISRGCLSIQRLSIRTLRTLARNMTSNASPASGTMPTAPSSATLAEHPRRDAPGRAERARLAHQPQRDRGRDEVADHGDQSDQAVDAVADIGAGQDEGDVEQFCDRLEPRQPLLAGEIAERDWRCSCRNRSEKRLERARPQRRAGISRPS